MGETEPFILSKRNRLAMISFGLVKRSVTKRPSRTRLAKSGKFIPKTK